MMCFAHDYVADRSQENPRPKMHQPKGFGVEIVAEGIKVTSQDGENVAMVPPGPYRLSLINKRDNYTSVALFVNGRTLDAKILPPRSNVMIDADAVGKVVVIFKPLRIGVTVEREDLDIDWNNTAEIFIDIKQGARPGEVLRDQSVVPTDLARNPSTSARERPSRGLSALGLTLDDLPAGAPRPPSPRYAARSVGRSGYSSPRDI